MPYCLERYAASLPAIVVLPAPCKPASRMTAGVVEPNSTFAFVPPMSFVISSLTILMTCWPGVRLSSTSAPTARSVTAFTKLLTTVKFTSASSSASFTSRMASFTSFSLSFPFPESFLNTFCSLEESPSNAIAIPRSCRKVLLLLQRAPLSRACRPADSPQGF